MLKILKSDGAEMTAESVIATSYESDLHVALRGVSMADAVQFFDGAESLKVMNDDSDGSTYSVYDGFSEIASIMHHNGGRIRLMLKKSL